MGKRRLTETKIQIKKVITEARNKERKKRAGAIKRHEGR